jgi:hypothetical protein
MLKTHNSFSQFQKLILLPSSCKNTEKMKPTLCGLLVGKTLYSHSSDQHIQTANAKSHEQEIRKQFSKITFNFKNEKKRKLNTSYMSPYDLSLSPVVIIYTVLITLLLEAICQNETVT